MPIDNRMSLPPTYLSEIQSLEREVLENKPDDVLQFCANFFHKRLEAQRTDSRLSEPRSPGSSAKAMSGTTFPGRMGAGANPFGGTNIATGPAYGAGMHNVMEEDENDTITSPTSPNFNFGQKSPPFGSSFGGFGGDGAPSGGPPSSFRPTGGNTEGFPSNYGMGRRTSVSAESLNPTAASNDNWTPPFHQKTPDQLERLKLSIKGNFLFSHLDDEQSSQILGALVEKPIPAPGIKVCLIHP